MIKEIKYQRCKQKFDTMLNDIILCPIEDFIWFHYPVSPINRWCLFSKDADKKEFKIFLYKFKVINLYCGLDKDSVIDIINKRYNTNNYKLVISD